MKNWCCWWGKMLVSNCLDLLVTAAPSAYQHPKLPVCYYFHNKSSLWDKSFNVETQRQPSSASSRQQPWANWGVSQLRARLVAEHLTNIRTLSAKSCCLFPSIVAVVPNLWYISIKESHRIFHICIFHKERTPNIDTKYAQNHQHIPWPVVRML